MTEEQQIDKLECQCEELEQQIKQLESRAEEAEALADKYREALSDLEYAAREALK